MAQRLTGKIAIVTGAASGNGRAIALAFAEEGAQVACADANEAGARQVADEIKQRGGSALGIVMDVTRLADCERTVRETVDAFGGLDILVNNAGILVEGTILSLSEADWERQQAVNVKGVFLMTKAALPSIIARGGGSVIITASQAGLRARPGIPAYVASKHAVVGLTRCLALDHAAEGVRVNAICPGFVETAMTERYFREPGTGQSRDALRAELAKANSIPLGRIGRPEDVAAIAVHLASDEAAWTTGICYSIDGGAGLNVRRSE